MDTAKRMLSTAIAVRWRVAPFLFIVVLLLLFHFAQPAGRGAPSRPGFTVNSNSRKGAVCGHFDKSVRFSGKSVVRQPPDARGTGISRLTTNRSPSVPMCMVPPYFSVMYCTLRRPKPWRVLSALEVTGRPLYISGLVGQ